MRTFLASTLLLLAAATGANAQILYGSFPLSGAQEVPPNGSANTGMANMSLNVATGVLTWSTSWTVPATAAHIHQAPVGANGGVIVNVGPASPSTGSATLNTTDIGNMLSGNTYLNVHSGAFPGGEIRGQVRLQWEDLGGAYGTVPGKLVGGGPLTPGSTVTLSGSNLPPGQLGLAWLAFAPVPFAFFGGTIHAFPFSTQVFIATNAAGNVNLATTWPAAIPSGVQATVQFLVTDPPVAGGIALTNGVRLTTP